MSKRRRIYVAIVAVVAVVAGIGLWRFAKYPPDTTPEGAYLRFAASISKGEPRGCFPYLEEEAQHAAFTIVDYASKASAQIQSSYPEDARAKALPRYAELAAASDGPGAWVLIAQREGFIGRMRRDLSGVADVEIAGERATVITARGARYSFRRRPNGIWGLTLFTAELEDEARRLARDWEKIQAAATDYERERAASPN